MGDHGIGHFCGSLLCPDLTLKVPSQAIGIILKGRMHFGIKRGEMPTVTAQGKTFNCEPGANLRQVLLQQGIDLYNGSAKVINCRGIGTCGTCSVHISGSVSAPNWRDRARRALPPHQAERDLRLACQTQVMGDIRVTKYDEFWGQGTEPVWSPEQP